MILLALSLSGCKKEAKPLNITGEWNLTKIETRSTTLGGQTVDVYISFTSDNKFELYQMLGTGRYKKHSGTWTLTDKVLNGKYANGSSWGSSYEVAVDANSLTLTSTSSGEVDTYKKTTIPSSVKDEAE